MSTPPLVLLPPSEGKAPGGEGPPWADGARRFPGLDPARRDVIAALRGVMRSPKKAAALLGVGPASAAPAIGANLVIDSAPTRPAIERYTGVLYDALAYGSLSATHRRRADEQIVILSAVWGAVAPRDPVPDYKLKMGATLPRLGRLATWWRPSLAPVLDPIAAGRVVWDLLPGEHAAAYRPAGAAATITVRFLDDVERNGGRRLVTVSHWNKLLKGALVRHVLANQLREPDGLSRFAHPQGYVYRPELTTEQGGRVTVSMVATR